MNTYRQKSEGWVKKRLLDSCRVRGVRFSTRIFEHRTEKLTLLLNSWERSVCRSQTRTNTHYGNPEEAISREKFQHMSAAAEWYMEQNPNLGNVWHLDVVAIIRLSPSNELNFEWFRDVESCLKNRWCW